MIRRSISVDEMVEILNTLVELDADAMGALISARVPCNKALADHPTVQVVCHENPGTENTYAVGILGILNGFFGTDVDGWGKIVVVTDDATGKVQRFAVLREGTKGTQFEGE